MVRKQLSIDDDLNDGLRLLAARTGRSESEHVRLALREYLKREWPHPDAGPDPLLELVGLVDDDREPVG
jgi:plasmid stability protein